MSVPLLRFWFAGVRETPRFRSERCASLFVPGIASIAITGNEDIEPHGHNELHFEHLPEDPVDREFLEKWLNEVRDHLEEELLQDLLDELSAMDDDFGDDELDSLLDDLLGLGDDDGGGNDGSGDGQRGGGGGGGG